MGRHWRKAGSVLRIVVGAALVAGCGRHEEPAAKAKPFTSAAPGAGLPPPVAPPATRISQSTESEPAPSPEMLERVNDDCKYRRSSGKLVKCARNDARFGAWRPTAPEVEAAVKLVSPCYCATHIELLARFCADISHTGNVSFTVGRSDESTDCSVTLRSAVSGARKFLVVVADNRDRATFDSTLSILDVTPAGPSVYYTGFNVLGQAPFSASLTMRSEWPYLPSDLRKFLGEDQPIDFSVDDPGEP